MLYAVIEFLSQLHIKCNAINNKCVKTFGIESLLLCCTNVFLDFLNCALIDPVGDGQHQPIHSRGLLPCGEEYGVVAGGYLLFTDYRVLLFALFASIT